MKLRIIVTSFVLLMQLSTPAPVKAAFPVKQEIGTLPNTEAITTGTQTNHLAPVSSTHMAAKPADEVEQSMSHDGGALGAVSFGLGVIGLFSIIAAVAFAMPGLLALSFLSAVGAIVTGAMSFNKKNKGFGIAGFAMGIIEVVPLVAVVLFLMTAPHKIE